MSIKLLIIIIIGIVSAVILWLGGNWALNILEDTYGSCKPEITISRSEFNSGYQDVCKSTVEGDIYLCPINRDIYICVKVK